ncbi:MAG: winged helix-turn-helix transcriptional regulator [Propionivibrio sp.]|jgi:DNA-binding MarR family transcriptional regulator|uniref:MarR family winged helix-turn-helix transcriptional regulator n=1 Tax=Propionivibrio sp. TaxID=2212460 RepID=UPI001B6B2CD4|nr:MarR family winged helix-turn-helix transcriptional regulator [Propionivibrio sp.]MBP7202615.1 winged helix-turn-helix transcriptional regulator [Propionivibrio sp.]
MDQRNLSSSVPDPDAVAVTELTLAVFRLNGVLLHWGDKLVAPLGLTSARWQMLGAIALADTPPTAPQVGGVMGITRQGAQKQLNLLTEQGLVKSHPNPANQRSPFYALTPEGWAQYRKADALWAAQAAELAALIPAIQASTATRTLESMRRALQTVPPFSKVQP